jgi:hypothetical protein
MPQKHQPDHPYLRHVRITRVHLFTGIQIISLAGMFAVKSIKSIAIGFPLLVNFNQLKLKKFDYSLFQGTCNMFRPENNG